MKRVLAIFMSLSAMTMLMSSQFSLVASATDREIKKAPIPPRDYDDPRQILAMQQQQARIQAPIPPRDYDDPRRILIRQHQRPQYQQPAPRYYQPQYPSPYMPRYYQPQYQRPAQQYYQPQQPAQQRIPAQVNISRVPQQQVQEIPVAQRSNLNVLYLDFKGNFDQIDGKYGGKSVFIHISDIHEGCSREYKPETYVKLRDIVDKLLRVGARPRVVFGGDVTDRGSYGNYHDSELPKDFINFVKYCNDKPVDILFILGNHETSFSDNALMRWRNELSGMRNLYFITSNLSTSFVRPEFLDSFNPKKYYYDENAKFLFVSYLVKEVGGYHRFKNRLSCSSENYARLQMETLKITTRDAVLELSSRGKTVNKIMVISHAGPDKHGNDVENNEVASELNGTLGSRIPVVILTAHTHNNSIRGLHCGNTRINSGSHGNGASLITN